MTYTKDLSLEQFRKFINGLSTTALYLEDIDMSKGIIRQATANKATLIDIDFTSIFDQDLRITNIKSKLPLLELLYDDKQDKITIQSDDRFWYIYNDMTHFRFSMASQAQLSTKFVTEDVFERAYGYTKNDENILYSIDLTSREDIHKKIKKICDAYNSDRLYFTIEGEKIELKIFSMDKRQRAYIFKTKNNNNLNDISIAFRSSFIDKLESKQLKNIIFFKQYENAPNRSAAKAEYNIEDDLNMTIYNVCQVG